MHVALARYFRIQLRSLGPVGLRGTPIYNGGSEGKAANGAQEQSSWSGLTGRPLKLNACLHYHTLGSQPIVTWWSGSGGIQAWSLTTNWFPSVLWHCWFGHLPCKNRPRNDLLCVQWDVKPYTLTHSVSQFVLKYVIFCKKNCRTLLWHGSHCILDLPMRQGHL